MGKFWDFIYYMKFEAFGGSFRRAQILKLERETYQSSYNTFTVLYIAQQCKKYIQYFLLWPLFLHVILQMALKILNFSDNNKDNYRVIILKWLYFCISQVIFLKVFLVIFEGYNLKHFDINVSTFLNVRITQRDIYTHRQVHKLCRNYQPKYTIPLLVQFVLFFNIFYHLCCFHRYFKLKNSHFQQLYRFEKE